jgi:asparagine synthase (glutamine-hydrolysing)
MCGLAGVAWTGRGVPPARGEIERMTDRIAHRGPDAAGCYLSHEANPDGAPSPGAALGHRRLSIIDVSGGAQPLANEDESVWVAFNGEIYNYRELIPELEAMGHRFHSHSDTEVIVHAWEQWGERCVDRFRGMFAFALWDHRTRTLFLARDRLGKKPLLYRLEKDRLLFASELKSILAWPDVPRTVDPRAVEDYLTYQYVPHPRSMLVGIAKLPPAHTATYRDGQLTLQRYWSPPYAPAQVTKDSYETCRARLRELLTEAVRLRLRSDVPLGAFLSGGIDSTIIAGLMQTLSSRPIQTFSIGFDIPQFDERQFSQLAATRLGTEHHVQVVEASALAILPKLIHHYDEPFADSSAIPMMYLSEMTRQRVTVSLSGDGGDELFAGYDRYVGVDLATKIDRLPRWLRGAAGWSLWQKLPARVEQKSFRRRLKRFLAGLSEPPSRRYLKWISIFDSQRRDDLRSPRLAGDLLGENGLRYDPAEFIDVAMAEANGRDEMTRATCGDVLTYLPCDILNKVDIATMAYSLEARCPFLDHHVAEFAATLPIEFKYRQGRGKRILVDAFRDLLPTEIIERKKMGFGVPLDHWFRGELEPLVRDVLLSDRTAARGWFNPQTVRRLVDEHVGRAWDHSARLWTLLVFELWQREWVDGHPEL